jgi:hypothetical protein
VKLTTLGINLRDDLEALRDRINKVWRVEHHDDGQHNFKTTQTTVGAAGSGTALPATPEGYIVILVNGEEKVLPYYAKS